MYLQVVSKMSLPQKDAIAVLVWATELLGALVMHLFMMNELVSTGEHLPTILHQKEGNINFSMV